MVEYPEQVVAVRFHRLGIGQVVAEQGCLGHQFVDRAVCFQSGVVFRNALPAYERRGSPVSGFGVYFHGSSFLGFQIL